MFEYVLKYAGINNMHEHAEHAQHVQHQLACIDLTCVHSLSLDFIYNFIYLS